MKLSARQRMRLGLAGMFLGVLSSVSFARQYIDDLVVRKLVVCDDLGVGGTAFVSGIQCCNGAIDCGGGEAEITALTVSFAELIFTPEDFTPPNCGGNVCEVLSVGTKIFNNALYSCNSRVSSIGLIPLLADNDQASGFYRIPSIDFKLPLDFINNGIVNDNPLDLSVVFDVHVLIPGNDNPQSGQVRLELFVDVVPDEGIIGGNDCPDTRCEAVRTVTAPADCELLRHYVFRYCLPAADIYDLANGPIGQTAPWVRVMIDRIDANEPYTGPVYLGVLDFVYPREFENVLYPDSATLTGLCSFFNEQAQCNPAP